MFVPTVGEPNHPNRLAFGVAFPIVLLFAATCSFFELPSGGDFILDPVRDDAAVRAFVTFGVITASGAVGLLVALFARARYSPRNVRLIVATMPMLGVVSVVVQFVVDTAVFRDGVPSIPVAQSAAAGASLWLAIWVSFRVAALAQANFVEREARERERSRADALLTLWEQEELRMRRVVADRLHGTVQHQLVMLAADMENAADEVTRRADLRIAPETVRRWALLLDRVREDDLHSLSTFVLPDGADVSTVQALHALLGNLPSHIYADLRVGAELQELLKGGYTTLPVQDRVLAVSLVEEAITNAVKHGHATRILVRVDALPPTIGLSTAWDGGETWRAVIEIEDDGGGLAGQTPTLRGLARHRSRIEARGGRLELASGLSGGARLRFAIPFTPIRQVGAVSDGTTAPSIAGGTIASS